MRTDVVSMGFATNRLSGRGSEFGRVAGLVSLDSGCRGGDNGSSSYSISYSLGASALTVPLLKVRDNYEKDRDIIRGLREARIQQTR